MFEQTKTETAHLSLHKYGNKVGKLLLFLTKGPHALTPIWSLKNKDGKIATDPSEIHTILKKYYKYLYSKDSINDARAEEYLEGIQLPQLTQIQLEVINSRISEEEIKKGINKLQNGKSPGLVGLTAEYYKLMQDNLWTPMLRLYNGMWEGKPYFNMGREAHRVIKKKG